MRRRYALEMTRGLAYVHSNGIIHGDIKTQNILITADDTVKITDFGTAITFIPHHLDYKTRSLNVSCLCYRDINIVHAILTGEQGFEYSFDVDVWALGMCLLEMEIGRQPISTSTCKSTADGVNYVFGQLQKMFGTYPTETITTGTMFDSLEDKQFVSVLQRILVYDNKARITSKELEMLLS